MKGIFSLVLVNGITKNKMLVRLAFIIVRMEKTFSKAWFDRHINCFGSCQGALLGPWIMMPCFGGPNQHFGDKYSSQSLVWV
jgi:hypothetical protein